MEHRTKQMAVAMAGVAAYLQMEQEAAAEQMADQAKSKRPAIQCGLWGLAGRQSMMQMRNLMELKALGRCR